MLRKYKYVVPLLLITFFLYGCYLGCSGSDPDYGVAILTDSDTAQLLYQQGDTLTLYSSTDTIITFVDTTFSRMEENNYGYPSRSRCSLPSQYQDIEYHYTQFQSKDSLDIVIAPKSSISYAQIWLFFKDAEFHGYESETCYDTLRLNGILYDSVYVVMSGYDITVQDDPDTLWYSYQKGIIGLDYIGERYWIQ